MAQLDEASIRQDPYDQLQQWITTAFECDAIDEPSAMTVATVNENGQPSIRTVLARQFDRGGIVFFTNYSSRKGKDLAQNSSVAALFYWGPLERQIRIEGTAQRVSSEISDTYFASRPHGSKIAALLSHQSEQISDRAFLEKGFEALLQQYPDGADVPRPDDWGGYKITPTLFEFWQGRPSRLHDRIQYQLNGTTWVINRLSP